MNTANENILKSLAILEQNLQDINSAKEQVKNVVKTTFELTSVIESYQTSFDGLANNIGEVFEASKKYNHDLSNNLKDQINKLSTEISNLESYNFKQSFNDIKSTIDASLNSLQTEVIEKIEDAKNQRDLIFSKLEEQQKESKTLKTILFVTLGLVIIGIVINVVI